VEATTSLREFLETRGAKLMDEIRSQKALSEAIEANLKSSLEEWKAGFSA
jgi:F0F1-type ATP synthase alpha subunit